MRSLWILVIVAACGGSSPIGPVRFANAPTVWKVDDRHDLPKAPKTTLYLRTSYYVESFHRLFRRSMRLERHHRSIGINALDEVPDSTWFTNRKNLSLEDIQRGPLFDTPERHLPWTIKSGKSGGLSIGFVAEDARGEKFVLKFDPLNGPEVQTAADAITARLLWAAGYNTPSDFVVYFKRSDLKIAPDAHSKVGVRKVPITDADLDALLANMPRDPEGRIRGLTSMYIKGKPVGGAPRAGVRQDDPNDLIPHELRRDLRGQAAFFAWLSHTDVKEDNTLDSWQEDPADSTVHYLNHYLIDFGWALGADAAETLDPSVDYRYILDVKHTLISIFSLGLVREVWEGRKPPTRRGIGVFSADDYYPGKWKPTMPSLLAILTADAVDKAWASRIIIRFTRDQIAAAVAAGRLTDPASERYLIDTLVARQRMTADYWFKRASPLDDFTVTDGKLCFTDLAMRYELTKAPTHFTVYGYDVNGKFLSTTPTDADARGKACTTSLPLSPGADGYTIYRIENSRTVPAILIYVANDRAGVPRVIGIHRL